MTYVTHQKMFHFASILDSDALYDKYAKKLTFYFNFLVKLLVTLVSPYFQLHKMPCLSFMRPCCKSDPPCNIQSENYFFGMSGVLFLRSQWLLKNNFTAHNVL